jgi:hypothetical protein
VGANKCAFLCYFKNAFQGLWRQTTLTCHDSLDVFFERVLHIGLLLHAGLGLLLQLLPSTVFCRTGRGGGTSDFADGLVATAAHRETLFWGFLGGRLKEIK